MKKLVLILVLGFAACGLLAAQPAPPAQNGIPAPVIKVEGKLAFLNGYIGLQTNNKTYVIMMPEYLYGFIDGLKEGAQVKLEGRERNIPMAPNNAVLMVTKLTVNGKDYDLSAIHPMMDRMRRGMDQKEGDCPMNGHGGKGGRGAGGPMYGNGENCK